MEEFERLRRHAESALDQVRDEIAEFPDEVAVSWPIANSHTPEGSVTTFHSLLGETCAPGRLLDVGGSGRTGEDGRTQISLNAFHCLDRPARAGGNTLGYRNPVNVVATPRSRTPVHLSVRTAIGPGEDGRPQDVTITVSSWDVDGEAVGGVSFNWRCWVPIEEVVG